MFKFDPKRVDDENDPIGRGSFGEVFPYRKNSQDFKWVVKRILVRNIDDLIACLPEIVLGFACDHPCVVPIKGYFIEKIPNVKYYHLYLKMRRMKTSLRSSLQDRKNQQNPFTETEIVLHFYSIVCGLQYLHSKKIYHGDIRHDNLLLDDQGNLKIADIGLAKYVEEEDSYHTVTGQKGTYEYSSPEILGEKVKKDKLPKADVWSLGVVLLELCAFEKRLLNSLLPQDKLQNKIDEVLASLEGKYQKVLIDLIKRALSLDPKNRPSVEEIKIELEKSFSQILNKIQKESNFNDYLKQQILKNERKELNETISQLKLDLSRQKKEYEDRIQQIFESKNTEEIDSFHQAIIYKMPVEIHNHYEMAQKVQNKDKFAVQVLVPSLADLLSKINSHHWDRYNPKAFIKMSQKKEQNFEAESQQIEKEFLALLNEIDIKIANKPSEETALAILTLCKSHVRNLENSGCSVNPLPFMHFSLLEAMHRQFARSSKFELSKIQSKYAK